MAESSLSLQLSDFAAETGQYLGFGRTATSWTGWQAALPYVPSNLDTQLGQIMAVIQAGYRSFLFPKMIDAGPVAHKWSFLTPQRSLTTVAGQSDYDLPDDFGGLESEFTYQPSDSSYVQVRQVGIGQVKRFLQQLFGINDKPTYCAVYPKQTDGVTGQRFAISFAPTPDAIYNLAYTSRLLPMALSATNPFPYGGMEHGETVLASCLAVAERRLNDEEGVHQADYMERLQASIAADTRNRPAYFGYNGDRSDMIHEGAAWAPWNNGSPGGVVTVGSTYNGIQY